MCNARYNAHTDPLRIHRYVSMFHNEMLSTGRLYVDKMLNECLLNVFTVLLICSSMKRCGIRSPHTIKYSLLHGNKMYLIVFMVSKSLSKSVSKIILSQKHIKNHNKYIKQLRIAAQSIGEHIKTVMHDISLRFWILATVERIIVHS